MIACAERTLSIVKPDAVAAGQIGRIVALLESQGLRVVAAKMLHLTREQAAEFYAVHSHRPFYESLIAFMSSGPILVQVLEGPDAVALNRKVMGSTNPAEAQKGTIRALYGTDVEHNAVHGSDSLENAAREIAFFFPEL